LTTSRVVPRDTFSFGLYSILISLWFN